MEPPVVDWCGQTWDALKASGVLPKARDASGALFVPPWLHRADGIGRPVPNVCLKLPTGAGKTYLATRGIEQLHRLYYRRAHGLVLWIVPSDAIYTQTWKTLANREHPYRMIGRILRQPHAEYFAESRAALNESHVMSPAASQHLKKWPSAFQCRLKKSVK